MQQPVVEATGVEFADAALQFVQMALLDLVESLYFLLTREDSWKLKCDEN